MRVRFLFILFFCTTISSLGQPVEKLLLNTDKQWYYPGEPIRLSLNTFNACTGDLVILSSVAYVELLDVNSKPVIQSKIQIKEANGMGSMMISDNISSGNYTLVAYTSWMKNFGAGTFTRKPVYIVNPARPGNMNMNYSMPGEGRADYSIVQVETSKKQFSKREPVTARFSTGARARVLVSVYKVDELEQGSAEIYISQVSNPCNIEIPQTAPFPLERKGHVISGRVIDLKTQLPAAGIHGYLSSVNHPDRLFMSTSDSTGTIRFEVGELTGKTDLVLQTDAVNRDNYIVELIDPFAGNAQTLIEMGSTDIFSTNLQTIDEAIASAQVQEIFADKGRVNPSRDSVRTGSFYGRPDGFYLMKDYARFNTVEEIIREYITHAGVKRNRGKLFPVIFDLKTQKPFRNPPLIIVNGVPIDGDQFMKMNTNEFYSIAVVAVQFIVGDHVFDGIIDVRLNTSLQHFSPNARIVEYDALQSKPEFESPDYSDESDRASRKPDFRNVLYWNPLLETDNNGNGSVNFFTSDLDGHFVVVVQAITGSGKVSISKSIIEVK